MYREIRPRPQFQSLIDCFWTFSQVGGRAESFKILPDACSDIIFDLQREDRFFSGVMATFQYREVAGDAELLGIRFKTEIFSHFSKVPAIDYKNLTVDLQHILPANTYENLKCISKVSTVEKRIAFLEEVIGRLAMQESTSQDHLVRAVIEVIRARNGNVNVGGLAKLYFISLRQLERRFKNCTGLTIKEFASIVRFDASREMITKHRSLSLMEISFQMGFFDNAHMNCEFKRIAGENPSSFR